MKAIIPELKIHYMTKKSSPHIRVDSTPGSLKRMTHILSEANLTLRPHENVSSFQGTLRANESSSQKVLHQTIPSYREGDWSEYRLGTITNLH